ncbi:MAG: tryptophan synthase subunit alpha [Planctomycetota bacterium]|jgi:tryptophan synthase alpha chain
MGIYQDHFNRLDRAALIPFFVIGDPDEQTSFELVTTAIDAGADVLELGIPFSDPVADGPTIQKADIRAMEAKMTPAKALAFIKRVTDYKPIPIGLLVYYNLIYQYGIEKFFTEFKQAGGTSVLVADLSIDDADEIAPAAEAAGLETVFMVTPNTADDRMKTIADQTTGFIYTVSVMGTTGQRSELSHMVEPLVGKLKSITDKPICVGFGISTPEHARSVAQAGADGVIIGSRIVKFIEENLDDKETMKTQLADFIGQVKSAIVGDSQP